MTMAPALGLPDLGTPFDLLMCEMQGVGLNVRNQELGKMKCLVAYSSKNLTSITKAGHHVGEQ